MPNTENSSTQTAEQEVKQPVKLGAVQRVEMAFPQTTNSDTNENIGAGGEQQNHQANNEGANATSEAQNGAGVNSTTTAPAPTEINDEQLMAMLEARGIKLESFEKLKEKVNYEPTAEPTPEQKDAAAKAKEKRMVDKFVSGGGTIEQYVAIKGVAEADLAQLSLNTTKNELLNAGFTDEQANQIIKDRYFQIADDELEQSDDETDKEYKKRLKEYGANKLANRSQHTKEKAAGILAGLNEAIESEDLQVQNELQLSSKIDEQFKTLPRKVQIEIGEIGKKPAPPIEYDYAESDLAEVQAVLKDPAQRNNILYNQDGSLNIARISQALLKEKAFDSAVKVALLTGQDRMTKEFQKVFPAGSAQELGVGGSQNRTNGNQSGIPAGVGKVQKVNPQRR